MTKSNEQFENFDRTMRDLMSVPHSEIKAAMDAAKTMKKRKRKAKEKPSVSGRAARDGG